MTYLWTQEAANLYVGDAGPDNSKHLVLENHKLPDLEELTQEHHAGGAIAAIEVGGLGIKALMSSFRLKGWDPQTMSQFGIGGRVSFPFTSYGLIRNKNGGGAIQTKAVLFGRMTKMAAEQHKRGEMMGNDYEIKEILHYELYFGNQEKFYWDFFRSIWRVDGVVQNQDMLSALAIP